MSFACSPKGAPDCLLFLGICTIFMLPSFCISNLETTRQVGVHEVLFLCHILMYQFLDLVVSPVVW